MQSTHPILSIVSPVYKSEALVDLLVQRLTATLKNITEDYEIILVEDCGGDNSWKKIEENAAKDNRIKAIQLSRNFGQHYAITAGLDYAKGEWVVVMDCDLQDRPEEIINLYNKAQEGYDIVLASRQERQDNFFKKSFSLLFYKVLTYLTGTPHDHTVANFGIYNRKVINALTQMRESIRYFPTMIKWVGFRSIVIPVFHAEREQGQSSYNMKKMLNLAIEIMLAYSDKPIRMMTKLGFIISIFSFLVAIIFLTNALNGKIAVMGYASIIISIWLLSGLIIFMLGITGLYVGKTFEGVKKRPIYLVNTKINIQ